jgi:hypothetical protein
MQMKLLDLENLARGDERQRAAFNVLSELKIFEILKEFTPVLVGALPLGVGLANTAIQLACCAPNLVAFDELCVQRFNSFSQFHLEHILRNDLPTVIAEFRAQNFAIEFVAQPRSVFNQPAVLLLLIEARLLTFSPASAREEIRTLQKAGLSTEDAFDTVFELEGIPLIKLLEISQLPDHEILKIAHRVRWRSIQ